MKTLLKSSLFIICFLFSTLIPGVKAQTKWDWVQTYGGQYEQQASDMVTDASGNIYIAGSFWFAAKFGQETFTANPDYGFGGFIAKFDLAGNLLWVRQINMDNEDKYASAVALDKQNNVYVTGCRLDRDGGGNMYLNKYSSDGNLVWVRIFDDYYWDDNKRKTLAVMNNVICVAGKDSIFTLNTSGHRISSLMQPVNTITGNGKDRFYTAKNNEVVVFDTVLTVKSDFYLDSMTFSINAMSVNTNGVYVTGKSDSWGMFTAKIDIYGNFIWLKEGKPEQYATAEGNAILVDNTNTVCVAGLYRNEVHFDNLTVGALGLGCEVLLIRYNEGTGAIEDLIHGGGNGEDLAKGLAIGPDHNLLVAGSIEQPGTIWITFGDILVPCPMGNGKDLFIAHEIPSDLNASISGKVTLENSPYQSFIRILRNNEDSTFSVVYRGQTDISGNYSYSTHQRGKYIVKTDNYHQIGTYYRQNYLWSDAEQINIAKDTAVTSVDMDMLTCSPLYGTDSISGRIYSSDGSLKSFTDLLLVNSDGQLAAFIQSDTLGNYCFTKVPKGQYKILIDSAGMYMDSYYTVNTSLKSASVSKQEGISFTGLDYIFGNDHKIYRKASGLIQLSVTSPGVTLSKIYDGTTIVQVIPGSLAGVKENDQVTVTAIAGYDNPNVGTNKAITVTYFLSGPDAGSYINPGNDILTSGVITKQPQIITWTQNITNPSVGSDAIPLTAVSDKGLAINYFSGDTNVAVIHNNKLSITGTGNVTITASQSGNDTVAAAEPVSMYIVVSVTGISGNIPGALLVYPNPSPGYIIVACEKAEITAITVYNLSGVLLYKETDIKDKHQMRISLSSWSGTMVTLKVETSKGLFSRKIWISKN